VSTLAAATTSEGDPAGTRAPLDRRRAQRFPNERHITQVITEDPQTALDKLLKKKPQ
jgi:hypothetical protein